MTDSNFTKTFTTDNFTQFVNNTNTIGKEVGGLARLTTTVDSDLVGAINELDSDIGARPHTTLNTNSKTITGAVNEIHTAGNASLVGLTPDSANKLGGFNDSAERNTVGGALNSLSADVRILDSDIGSARAKTTLSTTSKNIVGGINELDAEMGAASLNTSATTVKGAINELESNHDSAVGQLKTDIGNVFRYQTISGDTGSDTVDSANGAIAIVGDGIIQTTMSGNRLLVDHTVVGATDVNNSGKTYVQDITMDSAGHVTAIGSTAISGLVNNDVAAGAGINAEKIADGSVSNTEFQALNGITGNIQTQLDSANSTQFFLRRLGESPGEQINNNETITFNASGGTSVSRSGAQITYSSTAPSNSTVTIVAGTNISGGGSFTLNGGGGTITLTNNITNNNQLGNGRGYITSTTGGNLQFNNGYGQDFVAYGVRAWAHTNGGVGNSLSIQASGNIAYGTYFGTGQFRFGFTNYMPDASYAVAGMPTGQVNHDQITSSIYRFYPYSVAYIHIVVGTSGGANSTGFQSNNGDYSFMVVR